jgi:hypothetical protein
MGLYDALIATPIPGQPISAGSFGVPVRNAILDLDNRLAVREAAEALPPPQTAFVASTIAITSGSFAALPSPGPLQLTITNPSNVFDLEIDVTHSAWISIGGATDVRGGLAATGGMSFGPVAFGSGGAVAYSDTLFSQTTATTMQRVNLSIRIPAGAAAITFAVQAMRSTSGSANYNYPTLRIQPRRFIVP